MDIRLPTEGFRRQRWSVRRTGALTLALTALVLGASACGSRLSDRAIATAAHRPILYGGQSVSQASAGGSGSAGSGTANAAGGSGTGTATTNPTGSTGGTGAGTTGTSGATSTGTGSGSGAGGSKPAASSSSPGSTVNLGNVGTYSGVIGAVFSGAQQTMEVWQAYTNAHGGLNGHPVHLFIEDDGGDPSTSESDIEQEVTQDHVIAFVGNLVPLTVSAGLSYLQQQNIPVIGGDASSTTWWQSPVLFPQGGSDLGSDQAVFTIKQAAAKGYTKMGLLYCVEDPTCSAGIQSLIQPGGGAQAGVTNVYSSSFSITQPDFTAQCIDAKQAGATFIYFAGDGDSLIRMANDCAAQSYNPLYVGDSIAITANLASNPHLNGLIAGQTDFPWIDNFTPAQAAYQQAIKQYDPSLASSATTAAEWTAGELAVAVSNDLTANPTSQQFFQGLWSIKNNNLGGLAPPLTFNQGAAATPSNCYFLMTLQNGQFVDLNHGVSECVS